eukprot:scpid72910/ scgid5068/ 
MAGRTVATNQRPKQLDEKSDLSSKESQEIFNTVQQNLTHLHILDVGGKALDGLLQQKKGEQEEAVRQAVAAANAAADQRQMVALGSAQVETDRQLEELRKELDVATKKAVMEMKTITTQEMEDRMAEALDNAAEAAERAQANALERAAEAAAIVCDNAIEKARAEEREVARINAEHLAEKTRIHLESTIYNKDEERKSALADLTTEMLMAQEKACEETRVVEGMKWQQKMDAEKEKHDGELAELQHRLDKQVETNQDLEKKLRETEDQFNQLSTRHAEFMAEYKRFVDSVPKLSSGFLL